MTLIYAEMLRIVVRITVLMAGKYVASSDHPGVFDSGYVFFASQNSKVNEVKPDPSC